MRVLITGGAGFIGSNLARRLAPEHEVTALDTAAGAPAETPDGAPVRVVRADVRDAAAVDAAVASSDAVFHLAAVVGVPNAMAHQWDSITTTAVGTVNVLLAARRHGAQVLIASSSAVYGKIGVARVRETDDIHLGNTDRPAWTYSAAKLVEELLALAAHRESDVPVKVVRLFNVIGPGQTGAYGMVVPRLVDQALAGQPLTVYGDGTQTRTFVDVEDALDGLLAVWREGEWGRPYNVGGTAEVRIVDLAERVRELCRSASPIRFVPFADVYGPAFEETPRRAPDISRLRTLGYSPKRPLDETLGLIVQWRRGR